MLRVGVLGGGFMGGTHGRAYAKLPGVQVVGIASRGSPRALALAGELGARHVTEPEALIRDPGIDVIDVCYPSHEHERLAVAALQAGKHVFLEKPLALTLESADRILAAQRASGKKLMVGLVLRFWPEYVALHEIAASGRLGRAVGANAYRLSTSPGWSELWDTPELTGGAVVDLQIHDDDQLNWLLGEPRMVYSQGRKAANGAWDHVLTTVTYDGAVGVVEGSMMMPGGYPFSMGLRVVFEKGTLEYGFRAEGPSVEMGQQEGTRLVMYEPDREPQPIPTPAEDGWEAEVEYFVRCLQRDEPVLDGTPEQARLALTVALAARRSLETGEAVKL